MARGGDLSSAFSWPGDYRRRRTSRPALEAFSTRALDNGFAAYGRLPKRPGVCYFFPRPSAGSACKRLNLFLRWMVRRDAIDLGTWTLVSPIQAHHSARHARHSPGPLPPAHAIFHAWMADGGEITASLRALNAEDPIRYDFSLCHVGMMNACGYQRPQGDSSVPAARCLPSEIASSLIRDGTIIEESPTIGPLAILRCVYALQKP